MIIFVIHFLFLLCTSRTEIIEETFGDGKYEESISIFDHISSSIDDLHSLLLIEKSISVEHHIMENDTNFIAFKNEIDFDANLQSGMNYVQNPINALHLLVRCSRWFPKLFQSNHALHKAFSNQKRT